MEGMAEVLNDRELFIKWACVIFFSTADKNNSQAAGSSLQQAQNLADIFFPVAKQPNRHQNPFNDAPSLKPPPNVNVAGPAVPGERAKPTTEVPVNNGGQ